MSGTKLKPTALCFLFGIVMSCSSLVSAAENGGERSASYLRMGMGGQQVAMGGVGSAMTGDLPSCTWNPAALTGVRTFQVYTQYSFLTMDRTLGFLSLGNRLEHSPLSYALSWAYFSAGNDLEFRRGPSLEPLSTFSDSEMTFYLSAAYRLSPRCSLGLNLKIFTHWISEAFGWGLGEDVGVLWRVSKETKLAFTILDPFSKLRFQNADNDFIPATFKVGASRIFWKPQLTASLDMAYSGDLGLEPAGGMEWRPASGIALRAGWGNGSLRGGFGISTKSGKVAEEFNYVVQQDRMDSGSILHQVSLGIRFL